jgi:hypothetical protein
MRDYPAIAEAYCRDVVAGRVVAGRLVKLACRRHLGDLAKAGVGATCTNFTYEFDAWHAGNVCDFIEKLRTSRVAGRRRQLPSCLGRCGCWPRSSAGAGAATAAGGLSRRKTRSALRSRRRRPAVARRG